MCSIMGYCGRGGEYSKILKALRRTNSRGPDDSRVVNTGNGWLGFNRLSIMGITANGMQPFAYGNQRTIAFPDLEDPGSGLDAPEESEIILVCNGEVYGVRKLKEALIGKGYSFISGSDCEILPALYEEYGTEMFRMLDAEFAMIL